MVIYIYIYKHTHTYIRWAADKKCTQWNILPTEQSSDLRSVSL